MTASKSESMANQIGRVLSAQTLPKVAQDVPKRPVVRPVQPQPVRGLLYLEPTPPKGRGLFDYEPPPTGRLKR